MTEEKKPTPEEKKQYWIQKFKKAGSIRKNLKLESEE